ncbi:HEAT repeat domain-containing protein [Oscillatoria sp. FACHB-1406]|uniref:HEAT repeat domain-containing protein n=1 Tax=Oscillatoria sp. FACHB-1406 TaxID=2692846 RepID=UPI0016847DE3|nr:HEAT repeat domain-containing protein [Oscillatoria sp. FACHB-1406]MBD2578083.1 HEAT repeat domain-containing protein [Oscillatoria sp. FACHB-1406]
MKIEELINAVEKADSAEELLETVEALAAVADEAAIPTLIDVLGYNNPGAAVAAVDGLIAIGQPVVPILLQELDGYNYGARAWATRVFAGIGDPRAIDLLLRAASSDFSLSVRRAAARGLGTLRWEMLPEERREEAKSQTLETLLLVTKDPEWVVRYAAVTSLQSLVAVVPEFKPEICQHLEQIAATDGELAVCARARMALGAAR